MARSFRCEFKNAPCDDPRCKIGHCAPEAEINAQYNRGQFVPDPSAEPELTREAKVIARSILKDQGIKPTAEIVERVIAMPRVREMAIEHLRRYNELKSTVFK
jgi:hypothetical protein